MKINDVTNLMEVIYSHLYTLFEMIMKYHYHPPYEDIIMGKKYWSIKVQEKYRDAEATSDQISKLFKKIGKFYKLYQSEDPEIIEYGKIYNILAIEKFPYAGAGSEDLWDFLWVVHEDLTTLIEELNNPRIISEVSNFIYRIFLLELEFDEFSIEWLSGFLFSNIKSAAKLASLGYVDGATQFIRDMFWTLENRRVLEELDEYYHLPDDFPPPVQESAHILYNKIAKQLKDEYKSWLQKMF